MPANITKLNALRRLSMKLHMESPAPKKHKEWRIRIYDGETVVGYVGWNDLLMAQVEFEKAAEECGAKTIERR